MSFVGKILVILQVVFSLLFMTFAAGVYHVQTSWKEKAVGADGSGGYKKERDGARTSANDFQQQLSQYQSDMVAIVGEPEQINQLRQQKPAGKLIGRIHTLETDKVGLTQDLNTIKTELDTARVERDTQRAIADVAVEEAKLRTEEAVKQREVNRALHKQRDENVEQIRAREDELFTLRIREQALLVRLEQLVDRQKMLEKLARDHDLDIDPKSLAARAGTPPPIVDGLVNNAKKTNRNGPQLVEISIGLDDGILKGHTLFVFRMSDNNGGKPKYLGKIQIVYLEPDRAVGTVVEAAKNGIIQRGDNVTTKL